jgi:hypothetical protein
MIRLLAVLAIVASAILPARADDTAQYCIHPKEAITPQIEEAIAKGLKVEAFDGPAAQLYIRVVREHAGLPDLPGVTIVIVPHEGAGAFMIVFKGDKLCGIAAVVWPLHRAAYAAAKGEAL